MLMREHAISLNRDCVAGAHLLHQCTVKQIGREASQGHAAGAAAWKENVQPPNGAHAAPDSNGHSKAAETEPRTLAEVAETTLVRDVLCACQVSFLL